MGEDRKRGEPPTDDAQVGYGRPPAEHRFKANQVANSWGRKGKPKPTVDFLDEMITLTIAGRLKRLSRDQAIDLALYKEVMTGNVSAARELQKRRRERQASRPDTMADASLSPEDQAAFDRLIERQARGVRAASDVEEPDAIADEPEDEGAA